MPQPDRADVVDLLASADPVGDFRRAHDDGRLVALRTSGTTTAGRTVLRTTDSWVDSFDHVARLTGLSAASRVWTPGSLTATMNLFAAVHADWVGATRVAHASEATHAHLTPAALQRVLAQQPGQPELSDLHVVVAGDRLGPSTLEAAASAGVRVSHYYGAAELSYVAWADARADDGAHDALTLRRFPGVEVETRDGELWVRSPYLAVDYLEPDQRFRRDDDGFVTVGDRGDVHADPAGDVVTVQGRAGGITTAGATVLVAEIEAVLRPEARGEVIVLGLPHADLGEVVAAVLTDPDDAARLRTLARSTLAAPQRPRRWIHRAHLPLTAHGKVDRAALRVELSAALSAELGAELEDG